MTSELKTEYELADEASELLDCPEVDEFVRALDRLGWMIVVKPEIAATNGDRRWLMNGPGPCPAWADATWAGSGEADPDDDGDHGNVVPFPKR
jgi:hypothetical protein